MTVRPLPPAARPLYALGAFGSSLLQQTVLLWVFFFYAPPPNQGLSLRATAAVVGLALAAGRVVDAVADPLVGQWSDALRSPWGRRRPFIVVGAPLLAAAFLLLWFPPADRPGTANALFLAVVLGWFFFLYTVVLNPWAALLPELTPNGAGRVATASWTTAFTLLGIGAAFVGSSALSARLGFPAMGAILTPIGLAALLAPALVIREAPPADPPRPFRQTFAGVLRDRRFRVYLRGLTTMWFGLSMVSLSLTLIITVLMGLPRAAVARMLALALGATLAALPLAGAATRRWGQRRTLVAAMVLLTGTLPLLASIGRWPIPMAPAAQGYLLVSLASPALAALFLLPNVLLAGIAEDHARRTGMRAEGMFYAFQGLIFNGTTSLSAAVLGVLLDRLGYAPPAAWGLRVALLLAALANLAGALIFRRFPDEPADEARSGA